ncbi:MAG: peptide chain release factor 1 [Candidatus Azosocius agrarius]|nr:MAG: peptide chain release factor 1 [Gammaproteobacteria bacterium]
MKDSIYNKLKDMTDRYIEIDLLLSNSEIVKNNSNYILLLKERSELEQFVSFFKKYNFIEKNISEVKELLFDSGSDNELKLLLEHEIKILNQEKQDLIDCLYDLLIKKDVNDKRNVFIEIRAGTGGNEASIFSGNLLRMYMMYSEIMNWKYEIINCNVGEFGGYKEVVIRIVGKDIYSKLKLESGIHRVQRVPNTESQGRIHTSTCSVVIMPEVEIMDSVIIDSSDLKIDTYKAGGAGGQHVNKTDSAVRITHFPTGIVVECQQERSQHKNKARAYSLLQAKILNMEQNLQKNKVDNIRKKIIGTGDRSERIRTYNYPQNRITDHRINLTIYKLSYILDGNLNLIIDPLQRELRNE